MYQKGLVSIIIPAYNSSSFIRETLESIFIQTYGNYEVILVNDGSTDDTETIIQEYLDKILYLFQNNRGICAARNLGIIHARGEYIAFLDHDDVWLPQKLELQVGNIERGNDIGLVTCGRIDINIHGAKIDEYVPPVNQYEKHILIEKMAMNNIVGGASAVLVRHSVLDAVGMFDVKLTMAEDIELWMRILEKYKIICIDRLLYRYRNLPCSGSSNAENNIRNQVILIDRWWRQGIINENVKRKALSNKYYSAAWSFLQVGERRQSMKHIFYAFKSAPIWCLKNKDMVALFVRIIIGDRKFIFLLKAFQRSGHEKAI